MRDAYYCLYKIAVLKKQHEQALVHYRNWESLKSILSKQENKKYVAELETKYATQKKEVKIQIQQKEIAQRKSVNNLLLASLILIGGASALTATRFQLKRKKKEAALQHQFTRQLLQKTEEERGRIARDLHDGLSQELLLLKNQIKSGSHILPEKIDGIISEVRLISRNLHPVMLDQVGLKQSIIHTCSRLMESGHLFITTDIDYNETLSKDKELQLFRIIQEAITNIVKYADAHAAKVLMMENGDKIITEIRDNGKGFDVQTTLNGNTSFGLLRILERSKAINGKAFITSSKKGSLIKIEIPKND